ncbi:MAG: carbohydrate ABC transporter permease [Oscillospiraceae bacterium]|nr:carbohydrate ABC transporter permease [Oscillospiraceae bacterium]
MSKNANRIKGSKSDYVLDAIVLTITAFVIIVTLYPLIYVVSMSISDPLSASRGEVILFPKGFSILSYKKAMADDAIWQGYANTVWYTVVGTISSLAATMLGAYPLSRKSFVGRKFFNTLLLVQMFFGGGMIPTYIVVVKVLGLYNSRWAMILPALTSAFNIFIARNFILSLPEELLDCAKIDGASEFRIFTNIIIPLSKSVMSVLTIYLAIGYWNSYFPSVLYHGDSSLHPLGMYVRKMVIQNSILNMGDDAMGGMISAESLLSSLQLKYTVIVIAVLPLLLIYPFFSKYMKKGLMVGSIKG